MQKLEILKCVERSVSAIHEFGAINTREILRGFSFKRHDTNSIFVFVGSVRLSIVRRWYPLVQLSIDREHYTRLVANLMPEVTRKME